MAVLLALCSAATYGVGDFLGGMATKRTPPSAVVLWSHLLGVLALGSVVLIGGTPFTGHDFGLGALGGVIGALAIVFLYRGLAIGPMSVVAPVTALLAAAVPVVVGIAQGERPSVVVVVGMVAALAAIVMVSAEGGGSWRPSDMRGVALAMAAGFGFGLFFVALAYTDPTSGVWPLVGARVVSVVGVGSLALLGRVSAAVPTGTPRLLTLGAGVLDVGANVLYLLAIREGMLSVVAVLSSLYPVSTVVLARLVLKERFVGLQRIGMGVALAAAVLIAV